MISVSKLKESQASLLLMKSPIISKRDLLGGQRESFMKRIAILT